MTTKRKPDPFTPVYVPEEWHRTAKLDGERIILNEAFSTLGWDKLTRIEVLDDGRPMLPFREGDPFANMPYKGEGPGYLSRDELLATHDMTDAQLEGRVAAVLGIRINIHEGEDTPEKRFLRYGALTALTKKLAEKG
jgi:hypothetical protein